MGCTISTSNFRITAANILWGRRHKTCVSTDGAALTGGEYFEISSLDTDYYAWFDLDGGSTDPTPAGRTAVEIALTTGYSATDMSDALKVAFDALGFCVTNSDAGTCSCIEASDIGAVLSTSADVDTGLTIDNTTVGLGADLGKTEGGISVAFEQNSQEIIADQNGSIPADEIYQGATVTVTTALLEVSKVNYELLIANGVGDSYTPGGGTELVGFGTSKVSNSMLDLSGELQIKPLDRPAGDEDFVVWRATPKISGTTFSGTDTLKMDMEFKGINDPSKPEEISLFACGDISQQLC